MMIDSIRIGTLSKVSGPCGTSPRKLKESPGPERIAVAAVPIGQRPGEEVNEFGAGVLKAGKHFALVGQGHQKGLE